MRTLWILFLVILPAGCVFAQEPASQASTPGKLFGPFGSGNVPFVQPIVPSAPKVSVTLAGALLRLGSTVYSIEKQNVST